MEFLFEILQSVHIEAITPYVSDFMKSKITQEIIAWGLIYKFVIEKDIKKAFKAVRDEVAKDIVSIQKAIETLTETIAEVEKKHFSATSAIDDRVGRLSKRHEDLRTLVGTIDQRIRFLEEFIKNDPKTIERIIPELK